MAILTCFKQARNAYRLKADKRTKEIGARTADSTRGRDTSKLNSNNKGSMTKLITSTNPDEFINKQLD